VLDAALNELHKFIKKQPKMLKTTFHHLSNIWCHFEQTWHFTNLAS